MKKGFWVFVSLSLIFILFQMTGYVLATCTDSDGGQNYSVQGNITFNGQNVFQDYCFNDVFTTNTELKEGVCYGENSWGELYYQCPNGCVNGACVNPTVNTKTCIETDNGKDYYTKGNITEVWSNGGKVGYIDSCTNTNNEDTASLVSQGIYLLERYCAGNETSAEFYQCPNGCVNGACINPTVNTKTCIETDNGKDYYTKGNITEVWSNGGKVGYIDSCTNTNNEDTASLVSQGIYLLERYCAGNETSAEFYQCPNGCVNGACINPTVNTKTCIETDNGKDYYTKGNITEVWSNGGKVGYIDSCTNTNNEDTASLVSQGIYLLERYCAGNETSAEFYQCPNGCVNGACVQGTTKPTRLNASKSCTSGCIFDNRCYPMGYRKAGRYCSENSQFTSEVSNNGTCENNFECKSNLCIDNQCIKQGLFKKFINWFRGSNRR